jgi:hypothetical protein
MGMVVLEINDVQAESPDYINIKSINGYNAGLIHKNKIIELIKRYG